MGMACALLGVATVVVGCSLIGRLPAPDASGLEVYAQFLDERDSIRLGAALLLAGLALLLAFLASLRAALDPGRDSVAAAAMAGAAAMAIGAAVFSAAAIGALAVGAEDASPDSSRAVLDLAQATTSAAGVLTAVALVGFAIAARRRDVGALRPLALAAAVACLLWLAPLVTDADLLEPGSPLGFTLGLALLLVWVVATAVHVRRGQAQ